MLTKLLIAVLNGVVVYIVLLIVIAILGMVNLGNIASAIAPFAVLIAILVGVLTFLGAVPNYWGRWIS